MSPRRGFGILGILAALAFAGIVAVFAYNAGVSAGLTTGSSAATTVVVAGGGFGFFWILPILFLFFVFAAIARAGRHARHGWGGYYGHGYGRGFGPGGPDGPGGWSGPAAAVRRADARGLAPPGPRRPRHDRGNELDIGRRPRRAESGTTNA